MDLPRIFIPSRSRPTQQRTWAQFDTEIQRNIWIVVPPSQKAEYRAANPKANILACPKKGIGRVRQWLCENEYDAGAKRIIMLDDDMYFYHRIKPGEHHLATNTTKDNRAMLEMMVSLFRKGYAHVGIGARPEASHHLCDYRTCTRINNCHAIDLAAMRDADARFDRVAVMEDFDFILAMLQAGRRNAVTLDYVWNQGGSNAAGGCSDYRTPELQANAANELHALYPEYVKVVEKVVRGASSWSGMKSRTDVIIQWRKAYTGKPLKRWALERASVRKQ